MKKLVSEGVCKFCEKTYKKGGILRHLKSHLEKMETEAKPGKQKSYLIRVSAAEMFLMLWVDGNTTFKKVDYFLRAIWLECCGHMSSFTDREAMQIGRHNFDFFASFDDSAPGEIAMSKKVSAVFEKNKKLRYEYDFGSTTQLDVELLEEYSMPAEEPVVLLSRNNPLELVCDSCEKEIAEVICVVHYLLLCPKCAKKHAKECSDFADYAEMPVVNSPRMGVCGYMGGDIDTERDGIFVRK